MSERRIENAQIVRARLGYEGHGIFTAELCLEWNGGGAWFGGYALDSFDKTLDRRIGSAYGLDHIACILHVVGVEHWEDLKGQYIRVEHEGLGGKVIRIGHLIKDKWFDPQAHADEWRA